MFMYGIRSDGVVYLLRLLYLVKHFQQSNALWWRLLTGYKISYWGVNFVVALSTNNHLVISLSLLDMYDRSNVIFYCSDIRIVVFGQMCGHIFLIIGVYELKIKLNKNNVVLSGKFVELYFIIRINCKNSVQTDDAFSFKLNFLRRYSFCKLSISM